MEESPNSERYKTHGKQPASIKAFKDSGQMNNKWECTAGHSAPTVSNRDLDYDDVFGGPPRQATQSAISYNNTSNQTMKTSDSPFGFRALWGRDIITEIARRRNVSDDFYDDIFKGKCKDSAEEVDPSSSNLSSVCESSKHRAFRGRSDQVMDGKHRSSELQCCSKVNSWRDWVSAETKARDKADGSMQRKTEANFSVGLGGQQSQQVGVEEVDELLESYVIEFQPPRLKRK